MHELSMKPSGWFQIGWSTDLAAGDVKPLRYFGTDLVAYRDHDGVAHVMDAHCRHLGAHLGHGGCVVDGGLQCPFHGWVWDTDGNNVRIPYQDRPSKVLMRVWPVHEWNGVLSVWHDKDGRAPFFDPHSSLKDVAPHLEGLSFHPAGPGSQSRFAPSRVHPQMVVENAVDPAHFAFVHHTPTIPSVLQEDVTDWSWHSKVGFGGRWKDGVDRPEDDLGTLHLSFRGIGMGYNFKLLVPGHGDVQKNRNHLRLVQEMLRDVRAQVAAAVKQGLDLEATRKAVDLSKYEHRIAGRDPQKQRLFNAWWKNPIVRSAWLEARGEPIVQGAADETG